MAEEMTQLVTVEEPPVAENEQVKALLVLLKDNDAPGWREFAVLISHMTEMERQLADALDDLQGIHERLQEVENQSLKSVLKKNYQSLQKNVNTLRQSVSELKKQVVEGCKNILEDFQVRGSVALNGITRFLHLKPALETVQKAVEKSTQACDRAVSRIDAFSKEYHKAGLHLKNMGHALRGRTAESEVKGTGWIADAFKGGFKLVRHFSSKVGQSAEQSLVALARLEYAAQGRPSVLDAMREQKEKTEKGKSVPLYSRNKESR